MRDKYVEARFPRYFEFGTSSEGRVDLATADDDTVATVLPEHAEKLIQHRDVAVDMIAELAEKLAEISPAAFNKIWYGA